MCDGFPRRSMIAANSRATRTPDSDVSATSARHSRRCQISRPALRCALYARKSSEEGLDQAFNSLDAQRDACEACVKSQRSEGWRGLDAR